jgi:rare lipoprotein A
MKLTGTLFCRTALFISVITLPTPLIADPQTGIASVYSNEKTANGEYAYPSRFTAAHRTLPFGTFVEVTNRENGRSVIVRINDRGPFIAGRIIDLTPAGAKAIGSDGLVPVTVTVLGRFASGRPNLGPNLRPRS